MIANQDPKWAEYAPTVEVVGITKRYGQVVACDSVDLTLKRGQVHGVLGENGAGKSTLMKVLIGLVIPDSGQVIVDGAKSTITDPIDAASKGIGMVHQHFSVINALTVWENVALGDRNPLDPVAIKNEIGDLSRHYGLAIEPDAVVGTLTAGLRQRVEIIKCLRRSPKTVILDEPTSVLTPQESDQLFGGLRRVVDNEGMAIVVVSHKLTEIRTATDLITIMRHGKVVGRHITSETNEADLAKAMVGRPVLLRSASLAVEKPTRAVFESDSKPVLELSSVCLTGPSGLVELDDLSIEVKAGEIVGLAGVEGNGQRALGDLLSSLLPVNSGTVKVDGEAVRPGLAGAMAAAGVAVIPEDRHDSGCVLEMTVAENLFLADPALVATKGVFNAQLMKVKATELIERFSISCPGPDSPMWSLSGGNQQRVILAREMANSPKVLIAAQPTRGLDVGAIEYMSDQLRTAAESGVAVLLISTELEEILDLVDRVLVMSEGRIVGQMDRNDVDIEQLGLMMGGAMNSTEAS